MKNKEIAKILYEIAGFLEMEDIPFKPQAYERAALSIETLGEDIEEIYKREGIKGLENIPDVGKGIAEKIVEYLTTGKMKYYLDLKKKYPIDLENLVAIEGLGPKMIRDLYKNLGVKNLEDLEKAAKKGLIRNLPNFGIKTEMNILQGIEFLKKSQGRFLLGEILPQVNEILHRLSSLKEIKKISVCGSVRRRKETIGDVDILAVTSSPKKVMDFFCSMKEVVKVWGKGSTKSSVRVKDGFDIDLRIVPQESFGAALQYFTGNKEHNIVLRRLAIEKGLKLNEYGLFKGKKKIAGEREEDIYDRLGMECPPPEIRENRGEIEAAREKALPKLITLHDIKGDLHSHSCWDGGEDSIEEMVEYAMELGYEYLGVSDHTKFLKIEKGLDEKKLLVQHEQIEKLNLKLKRKNRRFRIFHGAEVNILKDGSLDIRDEVLKKLDYVIAGVHSHFKMSREEMTQRIIRAMKNPYVKIISHPTGRILQKRDEYDVDIEKIIRAARETNTVLEVNSFPKRLDLNDINIKKAIEQGVKICINSDAHRRDHLRYVEYGVYQARRGWAEKKDVINTFDSESLKRFFKPK